MGCYYVCMYIYYLASSTEEEEKRESHVIMNTPKNFKSKHWIHFPKYTRQSSTWRSEYYFIMQVEDPKMSNLFPWDSG